MQLYQNPTISSESSVSMKLLLWAQDYCPVPKWQTQTTVRVIRVIAKPTTWKTSAVLVPGTHRITVRKLWRKCSIKVPNQWKEYKYKPPFRCAFPPFLTCLLFPILILLFHKYVWVTIQHVHMHIHMFLWCFLHRSVLTPTLERYNHTLYLICA